MAEFKYSRDAKTTSFLPSNTRAAFASSRIRFLQVQPFAVEDFQVPVSVSVPSVGSRGATGMARRFALAAVLLLVILTRLTHAADTSGGSMIVFIDDVSSPLELKKQGIEPHDPEALAHAFDAIAAKNIPVTLVYLPIRQVAAQAVPVVIEIPVLKDEPPVPPERGLKLPDLQKAYKIYREAKAAYDERLALIESQREEARQKFITKSLDALAAAEGEITGLRRNHATYRASDVVGTIQNAIATAKTIRSSGVVLVLNTDLIDEPGHRRSRTAPFNDEELPPALIRALLFVNTSFKPDAGSLISKTTIPKQHAQSLKGASELVANLLPGIK